MNICCTKKLQDEMEIKIKEYNEENDIFSWSVNLIKLKRKKAVVVVNDSSRFGFILFGLKAKDFKKIDELIVEGIKRCLKDENIKEELIENYINDAGKVTYSKTKGPKYVSRLNKACECVTFFEELIDSEEIYQVQLTKKINGDYIMVNKSNYEHPYDLLLEDFKAIYGDSIIKGEAAQILVKLKLGAYTAKREIMIPMNINFKEFHKILQKAFEWQEYHLYDFNIFNEKCEYVLNVISEHEDEVIFNGVKIEVDSKVLVRDYMKKGFKIVYNYDYGDGWEHEIKIKKIVTDYDKNYPVCLKGSGDAPPEDVGGAPGYEDFLEIIENSNHPEYGEMKRWGDSQGYRKFELGHTNMNLRYSLR
ncbi:plasmid pRiA4b ORF-3 family protein [Clostridium sp. SHJSY1]|uniref:plasmid pRiA4b ORF-3 family protein n=1 Tax=Clostridium sp. SHJSY1 TaxID=2942483 RepID=UPI002874F0DC|nr:plasmid pRiA4b ORF-3 family protein [Clostridium sp. SHJSY1]MDS0525917.1 plasmid pRiA4b ORF-3 family protein [Clostridium sp. SHJSY1]